MEFFVTPVLFAIIATLVFLDLLIHKRRAGELIDKIPGPRGLPILGNSLDVLVPIENGWSLLRKFARNYYPVYKMWLFHWPIVSFQHPDDVQILLSSQQNIRKSLFYDLLHSWLKGGLLTSDGNKWRQRRKILTPAFHYKLLQDFIGVFVETSERMVISLKQEGGEVVRDVAPFFAKFSLNAICETAMGTTLSDNDPKQHRYREAVRKFGEIFFYRVPRPWWKSDFIFSFTPKGREQIAETKILHDFTTGIIKKRKQFHDETEGRYLKIFSSADDLGAEFDVPSYDIPVKKKRLAMLDLLIAVQKEQGVIDDLGLREEVDTFIFEGHDTTNSCISFTVALFAENKEIQARARAEIDDVLKQSNGILGWNELQSLTYLECCIKESLRLFPAVPIISRNLTEDLHLKHYVLPPGTTATIHVYDVHRDPNFWPEPEVFDPDRFLPEKIENRHPYSYIPFSAGPRNCIGQKFAMLEVKAFIGPILHNFYLEPAIETSAVTLLPDLVLKSLQPLNVKFIPISR